MFGVAVWYNDGLELVKKCGVSSLNLTHHHFDLLSASTWTIFLGLVVLMLYEQLNHFNDLHRNQTVRFSPIGRGEPDFLYLHTSRKPAAYQQRRICFRLEPVLDRP
jgi:hypothetical protein